MSKQSVQKNKQKRSWKNLSCQAITTSDLFRIQPLFCREVLPGDKFNVRMRQLSRLDSLPFPSFVNIHNRNIWYYMKMTDIWSPWNSFIGDSYWYYNGVNHKINTALYMTKEWFSRYFYSRCNFGLAPAPSVKFGVYAGASGISGSPLINHDYDLYYNHNDNTKYGATLNSNGRLIFNILYSLGFRIPYALNQSDLSTSKYTNSNVNLFALLAYANIIVYNFIPAKFRDLYLSYITAFRYRTTNFTGTPTQADCALMDHLFDCLLVVFYGSDYFTDSLQNLAPKGFESDSQYDYNVSQSTPAVKSENFTDPLHRQPVIQENSLHGGITYLSQYMLTLLKNKTISSQIASITPGSVQARLIGLLGIKSDAGSHMPIEIARSYDSIVVRPEINTADTESSNSGKPLGYKAGTAEQYYQDKDKHKFSFDDYGILICLNAIAPDYFYYAGTHREMLHVNREDFAQELYADTGMQAVALEELYNIDSLTPIQNFNPNSYFGFQSKYAEYGYRKDVLGGDFIIPTKNLGLDAFHFGRQFVDASPVDESTEIPQQNNEGFATANFGLSLGYGFDRYHQFDRIFNVMSAKDDHIQQWTYFEIECKRDVAANGDFTIGDNGGREFSIASMSTVRSNN